MTPFHRLAVGEPYSASRRHWPEGADYNWRGAGGHELRIFLARATPKEVAAIRTGPCEFGLMVEPPGLFLIARFGATSFDCSYSWHRMVRATGERTPPPAHEDTSPESRALLSVVLVEAGTGIVLALRAVTLSPEFSRNLHRAIADQAGAPEDAAGHDRWVASMLPYSTDELWERCPIRCAGGA